MGVTSRSLARGPNPDFQTSSQPTPLQDEDSRCLEGESGPFCAPGLPWSPSLGLCLHPRLSQPLWQKLAYVVADSLGRPGFWRSSAT